MTGGLDHAISAAVDYLGANQQPPGHFRVWNSVNPSLPPDSTLDESVFATACILYCLEWLHTPAVEQIRRKTLAFLQAERNVRGLYQYYASGSRAQIAGGRLTIPFRTLYDVDTTACVSFILRRYGTTLDNAPTLLANRDDTGLFRLWLMQEPLEEDSAGFPFICCMPHQNRACSGTTINLLLYLGGSELTQKTAERLAELFLQGKHCPSSPYYSDEIVLFYLYSRACFSGVSLLGTARQTILARLRQHRQPDGAFGSPLQTALALCTLQNFGSLGPEQPQSIEFLLKTQAEDGSWARSSFYIGHDEDVRQEWRYGDLRRVYDHVCAKLYFGSEEITTAYCLEALSRYREANP